jgi:hypothetical protein
MATSTNTAAAQKAIDDQNVYIRDTLMSIASNYANVLRDAVEGAFDSAEASTMAAVGKDLTRTFTRLAKMSDEFAHNQSRMNAGILKEKDITKQLQSLDEKRDELKRKMLHADALGIKFSKDDYEAAKKSLDVQEQQLKADEVEIQLIEKRIGLTGKLVQGLNKVPFVGKFFNTEEIETKMRSVASKGGGTFKTLGTAAGEIGKQLAKGVTDPLTVITFLLTQANKADQQTTKLAKSMMQTKGEAMKTREEFVGMANAAGDAFINTDKLIEANAELSKQLGFNKVFTQDMNQTFVDLTKKIGLSEDAAGGLARVSIATGKTLKSTEQTIAGVTSKISAQNGIQLDGKEILEESGKVSGQLLANFKGNPGAIAEAVAQTKLLGTTLEQTKNQADKLLDFESSIGNQLKAELLTGQQLNLERARAAALQGDQATVAKELASQNVNFNKFSKMNVIQQNALAESLGLSSDQLSDQLLKQEAIGKSRSEVVALGGEEAAKRLEALTAQDKFNAAVQKMQDLFGNIVAGPLGMFLDVVSDIAGLIGKVIQSMQDLMGNTAMKALIGAVGGFAVGGPIGALVGGVGGLLGGLTSSADDMVGYGARTLLTPTGAVALNNNDTVIAGTNLFKGDDVTSFPKGALNLGGGNGKLEELMSTLIDVTKSTKIGVNLDGRAVGTGIVRATYQSA